MVFRDLSINRKLTLIMMVTSSVALLVACAGFMAYDLMTARQAMVDDLTGHAHLFGANSTAALTFADSDAAAEMLSSLRAQPHITDAILYDIDGKLCARYSRDKDRNNGPLQAPKAGHEFGSGCLHLVSLIELNGKKIGTIYLRSDLRQLYVRIQRYLVITAVVLFCASSVAYLLLVWLKRIISGPITQLAQTARAVSTSRDYSIRAVRESNDELGVMIDCFNEMLTQVQQRAEEVRQHREHLEDQVRSRTNELQQTNIQLSAAKDRAEAASRAKSTFLANMSHEIRTPMTAIIGYSDMMVEGDQTASDRLNALQIIRRNARHLTDLINDILDISKIEAGKSAPSLWPAAASAMPHPPPVAADCM